LYYGTDSGAGQQIAIRGVGLAIAIPVIEAPIATYIDGVYQVRSFRTPALGLDLKRVEVLRGPQGTLFGRNATGGALNIILEDPTEEFTGKFKTGLGSYGQATVQGIASGPLIKGLLTARLVAAFDHYDGDIENVFAARPQKYINGSDNGTGRLALRFRPTEWLTADLTFLTNKLTGGAVTPSILLLKPGTPAEQAMGTLFPFVDQNDFVGPRHPHKVKLNRPNEGDTENVNGAFTLLAEFGWASLRSITGYQEHASHQKYDVDGTSRDLVYVYRKDATAAVSQEFNLFGTTRWFNWLVGSHYMTESYQSNFDPVFIPGLAAGVGAVSHGRGHEYLDTYSFFGDATVPLPAHFKAFGGLRFTSDRKKLVQSSILNAGGGMLLMIIPTPVIPINVPSGTCDTLKFTDHFSNLSPRYGLQWEPSETINVYAKQSFGYNAGGHNAVSCDNPYNSETLDTIETGVKSRWFGGKLVANVALFRNEFKNFQIFKFLIEGSNPSPVIKVINADAAEMFGGEFELIALLSESLTLNAGLSLLHSKYVKYSDRDDENPNGPVQDLAGKQLSNAPNYTISLGAEYAWSIPEWLSLGRNPSFAPGAFRLRGEVYHTDYIVFRPFPHPEDRQSNYSIVNSYATVASRDEKFELRFFAKNLTDTQYFGFKLPGPGGLLGEGLGVPGGPPRNFGTELTVRF
jgi:iron complex outermembrane receptor protein